MSSASPQPSVEYRRFGLTVYTDGSVHRAPSSPPLVPACPSPSSSSHVASKDITLNSSTFGISARLFLPPLPSSSSSSPLLPILLYYHGGGFIHFTSAVPMIHSFLCRLASHSGSLIISVDYRLAPEYPLPAAYEDCFESLLWLNHQASLGASAEPWLANHGDFSRCFMVGDSAGGTIAHYVAMQAVGHGSWKSQHQDKVLTHVCVQGLIMVHPYFTCGDKKEEIPPPPGKENKVLKYIKRREEDPLLDPMSPNAPSLVSAKLPPVLVFVAGRDTIKKGGIVYYELLRTAGKQAKLSVAENETHAFQLVKPDSPSTLPLLNELQLYALALQRGG